MIKLNLNILKPKDEYKPTIHDVNKIIDADIEGDYLARLSLFTNWILGNENVMLTSARASGKTAILNAISKFVNNSIYEFNQGSDKSNWYDIDNLEKAGYVTLTEINKMPKDMIEVLKDWGEGKDSKYRYTSTDYTGKRGVQTIKLNRKPFVFCLAEENDAVIGEELMSRITVIRCDSSIAQNRAVMKFYARLAKLPENERKSDPELLTKIQTHLSNIPKFEDLEYKHPASEIFIKAIPDFFTDCRRDIKKYYRNTYGITRFHYKDRMIVTIPNLPKKVIFVTPQDMFYNHIIYGQTLIESSLKCTDLERVMIDIIKNHDNSMAGNITKSQLQKQLKKKGQNLSNNQIVKHLTKLCNTGYIEELGSTTKTYEISPLFEDFITSIDWKEVCDECANTMKQYYPDYAEEYINRYINNATVIHPILGETIELKDWNKYSKLGTETVTTTKTTTKPTTKKNTLDSFNTKEQPKLNIRDYFDKDGNCYAEDLEKHFSADEIVKAIAIGEFFETSPGKFKLL